VIALDIMTENPARLGPTATVREAVVALQSLDVRHLPIVDEQGALVGMLSDRDLRGLSQAGLAARVADLMSADVLSVETDTEVEEIVALMLDAKIGAVPVVDGDGALVGIVSYVDVLREAFAPEAAE
jgi:CBS domain-containing protein